MDQAEAARIVGELQQANGMSGAELAALQDQRFRHLLRRAQDSSPYYRRLLAGRDVSSVMLDELPVMTKSEMMESFDEIVTDPALRRAELLEFLADNDNIGVKYLDKYAVFQSSGTTGETAVVVYDETGLAYFFASLIARRSLPSAIGPIEQYRIMQENLAAGVRPRIAYVIVTSGPMTTYVATKHTPEIQKDFIDQRILSTSWPISRIVAELDELQPQSLVCYPSTLEILAREQLAGRLHLSFDGPTSEITTGGEPLTPVVVDLARRAFGIAVQDAYGLTECLALGRSCSAFDGLHLMTDLCIVEVVDERNRPVPDGEPGAKLLVTNLVNAAQPVIRYEVTDVTGLSTEKCGCGWAFPKALPVAGRTNDIFYIGAEGGGYETLSPYRLGFVYLLPGLKRFQLLQTARNEMTFRFVPVDPAATTAATLEPVFTAELAQAGLAGRVDLRLEQVEEIAPDARSGKLRQITSLVGPPADLDLALR